MSNPQPVVFETLGEAVDALIATLEKGKHAQEDSRMVLNELLGWHRERFGEEL